VKWGGCSVRCSEVSSERITERCHPDAPKESADDVIPKEFFVGHTADAGENRRNGAHDRHKARKHDRPPAVSLIKKFRALEVFLFEEERIFALKEIHADICAKPITDRIAEYCETETTSMSGMKRKKSSGGEKSRGKKERVAGKKYADEQSALEKMAIARPR